MTFLDDRTVRGLRAFAAGIGPGDVLDDRYELREPLGEGGMSIVYAGFDRETKAEVAIKVLREGTANDDDEDEARFVREVGALMAGAGPAVVRVLAHGTYAGERYIVMERLVGSTLAERLVRGVLSVPAAIVLGKRLAEGLVAVHAAGIVHRDLKPANVYLVDESVADARIVDFGVARHAGQRTLTRRGALVGTPGYMAPEQVRGEKATAAADVFALGAILWECIAGRPVFDAESEALLHSKILLERAPPLTDVASQVPAELSALVDRMLAKDASARPPAHDVVRELDAFRPTLGDAQATTAIAPGIAPGTIIGEKYEVEGLVGAGGMGIVVAAKHLDLGTRVALKLLRSGDASDHARFLREARAASRLESDHVVRVLDVGRTADGRPFMVMEHLEGVDLARRLAGGPLPESEALAYVLETCEAIAEAHALGIIHRDLKPSNLFVAKRKGGPPILKVLDFGISKLTTPLEDHSRPLTLTDAKTVLGSIPYMSPEQVQAASNVDARSDIWALGVVLFELLSARRPFEADEATALAARIAAAKPLHLREVKPDASALLETVIARCLEKDPAARFPDLAAFARALAPLAPERTRESVERVARLLGAAGSTPAPASAAASPANASSPAASTGVASARATSAVDFAREADGGAGTNAGPAIARGGARTGLALGAALVTVAAIASAIHFGSRATPTIAADAPAAPTSAPSSAPAATAATSSAQPSNAHPSSAPPADAPPLAGPAAAARGPSPPTEASRAAPSTAPSTARPKPDIEPKRVPSAGTRASPSSGKNAQAKELDLRDPSLEGR